MRRSLLVVLLAGLLLAAAGCRGGAGPVVVDDRTFAEATRTAMPVTPLPTSPPTAADLPDPDDPKTVVLGGQFSRGGYWTWEDISNLLGVYAQYGAYETVTAAGQTYSGVPLSYLLDYARVNPYAQAAAIFDRASQRFSFTTSQLRGCANCIIALSPGDTLTLVLPSLLPEVIPNLVRIDVR